MTTNIHTNSKVHLDPHDFQRINHPKRGSTLRCDAGLLWVTQSGDRADYILWPGDSMKVTKRGKLLVQAMREADFHLA